MPSKANKGLGGTLNASQAQNRFLVLIYFVVTLLMFIFHVTRPYHSTLKGTIVKKIDVALASTESYGFFYDVYSREWALMKQRVKERINHNDKQLGQRSKVLFLDEPGIWYQNNWEPDFSCKHERRVGGLGIGGRWVCDPHRIPHVVKEREENGGKGCLIYSVSPFGDLKFEYGLRDILGRELCEIHVFDNSRHYHDYKELEDMENVHFHPWSLESSTKVTNAREYMTLQESIEALGHKKRVIDIFKIDCEKCEWDSYNDWFNSDVVMMQILVEVHGAPPEGNSFFETMQKLNYVTFHKEPNIQFGGGTCLAYSFLKLAPGFFT